MTEAGSGERHATVPVARRLSEMLGLVRGVLADGVVNDAEARALAAWVEAHPEVVGRWPFDVLARRLAQIFEDGRVDDEERADLADLLGHIVGQAEDEAASESVPSRLPFTDPPPVLTFEGKTYVFTGRFVSGSLAARQRIVVRLGGRCEADVTEDTDFVVVGAFGGRDWDTSPSGAKVLKALELQRRGIPVAVVSEDHWISTLP